MRAVLIAILIVLIFVAGKYIMAAADKAQEKHDIVFNALQDLGDCRKDVYDKEVYAPIRAHLYASENLYRPTTVQMVESSTPTADERKLLATYNDEVRVCKNAAADKITPMAPEMTQVMKDDLAKADDVMKRLIDGSITWGEAAHLSDNLIRSQHTTK